MVFVNRVLLNWCAPVHVLCAPDHSTHSAISCTLFFAGVGVGVDVGVGVCIYNGVGDRQNSCGSCTLQNAE